ncbi:MnhB domain-containing protein [Prauserella muralis]|uniref:Cation transporter n=1 Tax=Prauserella muralis TaxID=588067 RepID=A0A2V4AH93_9PSEU|nr:MnhB domain-containing protein [Prauserella muralis]PXY19292.1 cation transporter [Prauserella muralis]TWE29234.1 multisubunit sodium/proton antiporter MrpB subunit [Prauserella muralis]
MTERQDWEQWDLPTEAWLRSERGSEGWPRSLQLEVTVRVLFPTVLVFSVYLLLAGHHAPGGGFSGGLVAGLAFVLRYVAGGSVELASAARIKPPAVIGAGLSVAVLTALVPVAFGHPVLASTHWEWHVAGFGDVKLATNLFFDIGVYLLIVGLVLDLLRSLGAGIETRDLEREQERERRRAEEERR